MTDSSFSLKEALDDTLLQQLDRAKKDLHTQEQKRLEEEKKKRERARKEREHHQTFEQLLDEYGFGDIPNK